MLINEARHFILLSENNALGRVDSKALRKSSLSPIDQEKSGWLLVAVGMAHPNLG